MITKTYRVAAAVKALTGNGSVIFNDRLSDGRRSLKVWQWGYHDYLMASALLNNHGCTATIVKVTLKNGKFRFRMHVVE